MKRQNKPLTPLQTEARARLGAALRARRVGVGLTQQGLADRLGVNMSTISLWESGKDGGGVRMDALVEAAAAMGGGIRLQLVDGSPGLTVAADAPLPPEVAELRDLWGTMGASAQALIRAAIDLARRSEGEPASGLKKFA